MAELETQSAPIDKYCANLHALRIAHYAGGTEVATEVRLLGGGTEVAPDCCPLQLQSRRGN